MLGPRLDHPAVTWLLERYGSPAALRKAGRRRLVELIRPKAPRMAGRLVDDIFDALDEQTVVVPGTGTLDIVIPSLAASLAAVHDPSTVRTATGSHPAPSATRSSDGSTRPEARPRPPTRWHALLAPPPPPGSMRQACHGWNT